jgi:lipopolysaccharide biosynthesis glycosyltransferase
MSYTWFFALGEKTPAGEQYCEMAKVAVHTALQHTSLKPHFVYDGEENSFTRWLRDREIPITFHKSSLAHAFPDAHRSKQDIPLAAALSGAFLRIDLPEIASRLGETERIFYTDCDVIFRDEVTDELDRCHCEYFAVAPEFSVGDYEQMNTGAMLMNIVSLRESLPRFREFVVDQMPALRMDAWDQSAYRRFYRGPDGIRLWDELPASLNWKPYWGDYSKAKIIHFHGPKPYQRDYIDSHYLEIKHLTGGSYKELVEIYQTLLTQAGS